MVLKRGYPYSSILISLILGGLFSSAFTIAFQSAIACDAMVSPLKSWLLPNVEIYHEVVWKRDDSK